MQQISMNEKRNKYTLGIILACAYVFFSYIAQGKILDENFIRISLYLFLAWAVVHVIKSKVITINPYIKWYTSFIVLCTISLFYSKYQQYARNELYSLLVILGVTFAFIVAIKKDTDLVILFWAYSSSSTILFVILFFTGNLYVDERLGTSLSGNANIFATMFMLSAFCSIWLFIFGNKRKKMLAFISLLVQLYALALSGGRKYILVLIIFLYIILLLKKDAKGRKHIIKNTIISASVAIFIYWTLFNIPIIYNTVGRRIETFLYLFTGSGDVDNSTLVRIRMVTYGFFVWLKKPIFGYGINNFMGLFGKAYNYYVYAHNNYIELLVDLGIIGFALYYFFYFWLLSRLTRIKSDESGLSIFFIAYIICISILEIGAVTYNLASIHIFLAFAVTYVNRRIFTDQAKQKDKKANA